MQCLIDRFFRDRLKINFEKGKTFRRSGETELSSVAGFQNPFEIIRSENAAPGINESAGDVSDHVVEKAFAGDVDPDEGPHFPKADLMDKPHGIGGDGVVPTEGSKVVAAFQYFGGCFHFRKVELLTGAPDGAHEEGRGFAALGQQVAVGLAEVAAADGEVFVHLPALADADIARKEGIHGVDKSVLRNAGLGVEGTLLPIGMDAGIGAGDKVNGCLLSRQLKECILEHFLHGHAGGLALEAGIVCSFVGNGDPDISHGMILREK